MSFITLSDRSIIITGAGSGMGRAAALIAAREGAHVVVGDVNEEGAKETVSLIEAEGGKATYVIGDIAKNETAVALVEEAKRHGPLRGVVNNAGVMDNFAGAGEMEDTMWAFCFGINVTGPFQLIRAALPELKANGGAIVNVASEAGARGAAAGAAYTASKHALVGLTRNTAYRYGKENVRCNAVLPGGVNTNIGKQMATLNIDQVALGILGVVHGTALRTAEAPEVGHNIVYLLSDEAINVNGVLFASDGGWLAG